MKRDSLLQLQMSLAIELGYTLKDLGESLTYEELELWSAYYGLQEDAREAQRRKR